MSQEPLPHSQLSVADEPEVKPPLDMRLLFDNKQGFTSTLFLGEVQQIPDVVECGLRSAIDEVRRVEGSNPRLEARDQAGWVVYTKPVPL